MLDRITAKPILFQRAGDARADPKEEARVKARRITEITVETDETFTIRRSADSVRVPCPQCGSLSAMVTPNEAAALFGVGIRDLCREIDAGRLHFQEIESGSVLICLGSLQQAASLRAGNSGFEINQIVNQIKENPS